MGHRWITSWLTIAFTSTTSQGKVMWKLILLSRIDWEKCDETIQADSIQAIVAAAIIGNVANHIEAIPSGSNH